MKRTVVISVTLILIVFMSSCKTTTDVANSGLMQKRKYRAGLHLNLGKKKVNNESTIPAEEFYKERDSVIAEGNVFEHQEKWWQSADGVEHIGLSAYPNLSEKATVRNDQLEPKFETQAPERKFGRGKYDTNFTRKVRDKYLKPIEPSEDPERDGIISVVLLALFFAGLMSLPIVNLVGSIFGLIYGIKAKRGGEDTLGTIGVIGNAIALGLSILYSLVLLLYLIYFIFIILLGLGLII